MIIMNALNGLSKNSVWSNIYILQIIMQQELEKLTTILLENFDLKDITFLIKIEDIHKTEKKELYRH